MAQSRASLNCSDGDVSDAGILADAGPGHIETLLADIYHFEVSIKDESFGCHSFPFALKSSYFKDCIETFKRSPRDSAAVLRINLSELPGGRQTFELIRGFCFGSKIRIMKENVLDLLSASKFLGFTEEIAPENLSRRCHEFVEMEIANGIPGIMTMLEYSTNDSCVTEYEVLFERLAVHALELQDHPAYNYEEQILGFLLELQKLRPGFVNAALHWFKRIEVNMIDFFWCQETPTNLDFILGGVEHGHSNGRSMINYFAESLHKCIDAGEILVDMIDPKKVLMVWTLFKGRLLSQDDVKAYVSSKLHCLKAKDIKSLSPELIWELLSAARWTSRRSPPKREEIQSLGDLVDELLLLEAERCPWDGSLDSHLNFQHMAECVPLNERESHDKLHDAVACFSQAFTQSQSADIWNMIDTDKLSLAKVQVAFNLNLSHQSNYLAGLWRRLTDYQHTLKRKIETIEELESKRRIGSVPCYNESQFTIFVRSQDGKSTCVLVQPHTTIFSIKKGIEEMGNIQVWREWCLVYRREKLLSESRTIASYGIQKDCTLCIG